MLSEIKINELYNNHKKQLLNYVFSIVRDAACCEDIVHDAFVNLLRYSENHTITDTNLKSFLYKICRNLCINYNKRKKHIQFVSIDTIFYNSNLSFTEESSGQPDFIQVLEQWVCNLSMAHLTIFKLKFAGHLSNIQIAQNLGISERTVRRKLKESQQYVKQQSNMASLLTY